MKRYEAYKNCNIPWIKQIPSHWMTKRAKFLYKKEQRPVREEDSVVTCFRDGVVTLRKNRRTTGFTEAISEFGYQGIRKGDLVIHVMDAFAGAIGVSDSDGKGTPVYNVCTAYGDSNNYYYAYALREMARAGFIQSLYRGIRERSSDFRFDVFERQYLPVPPREEQDQIVRYLDWQVSKINRLIAAKREKIALFEELKTHQITDAVLHGVKQYKKYIKTQEFGRIPAHWQIYQNKRLFRERVEHSEMGTETLLSVSKHYGVKPSADLTEDEQFATIKPALSLAGYKVVHKNDLVMNIMRARNGSYGISAYNGIVSPAYCIYYVTKNCNVKYLHYFLRTPHVKSLFETYSSGIAEHRRRLYPEDFLRLASVLPPIEDQNEIAEYIEQSLVKYDEVIANLKRQIACLQDMKIRLISDVVTGQVDVRGIKVPDDEYINNEITEEEFEEESENNEEE